MPAQPKNQSTLKTDSNENVQTTKKLEPEKDLFAWRAPARPFKRRNKEFWTRIMVIAAIFGLILFLIEGAMPVILIISIIFLYYVLLFK